MTADEARGRILVVMLEIEEAGFWVRGHWDDSVVCLIGRKDVAHDERRLQFAEGNYAEIREVDLDPETTNL